MRDSSVPNTIGAIVDQGLSKYSGTVCATKREGVWISTNVEDFIEQMHACAAGLFELGIRKGDRVAIHSENSTEWVILDQALLRLGAVTVPIYTTQPKNQIAYIARDARIRGYIVSTAELFAECPDDLMAIPSMQWIMGLRGAFSDDMISLQEVMDSGRARLKQDPELIQQAQVEGDDLATLVYTSGTTGKPKGVMLSHANIASNVLATADRLPFSPPGRMLSYLPLSHSFERMVSIFYLSLGFEIHFVESFLEIREDLAVVRPKHLTTVPRLLEKIHAGMMQKAQEAGGVKGTLARWAFGLASQYDVANPKMGGSYKLADKLIFSKVREGFFGGCIEGMTSGGAALSPKVEAFFNGLGILCGQGYGLTETSPVVTVYDHTNMRPGTVGTAIRDVEIRIADDGEILVRGPNIMQGYYNMPEETASVITEEGWFHTGDIGKIEDGQLYITDRKKQLFKLSTGKYVAPSPIEVALISHPLIEHAVVVGSERKFCGALLVADPAAIRQQFGAEASEQHIRGALDEVVASVNSTLPAWEQIKKYNLVNKPFSIATGELTPTLKVKRRVVSEKYRHLIDNLYES
ncbi:MAG: long-chain fatty acid--CoA ligase [Bacteroidota bacterium]|nr:long-chain fatty acid--CoA ligase [Bacteroidota bacterium]